MKDSELIKRAKAGERIGSGLRQIELLTAENKALHESLKCMVYWESEIRRNGSISILIPDSDGLYDARCLVEDEYGDILE